MLANIRLKLIVLFLLLVGNGDLSFAAGRSEKSGSVAPAQVGVASWYGGEWIGRRTASGERYAAGDLTAAHRSLRFGTLVRVTNLRNNRAVVVRINNRGPYSKGRILDLSKRAAMELQMMGSGTAKVRLEVVSLQDLAANQLTLSTPTDD